jgi:hypothetical protein
MDNEEDLDLDPDLFRTFGTIDRYGWAVEFVFDNERAVTWAYTVGLAGQFDHPELALVGFGPNDSCYILNELGDQVRRGRRFSHGDLAVVGPDDCASLLDVHRDNWKSSLFAMWLHYYSHLGPPYPEERALEVVMPGRVPRLHRAVKRGEDGGLLLNEDPGVDD